MSDTVKWTAIVVLFASGSAMGIASTATQIAIVEAVNAKLARPDQFAFFGGHPLKLLRLRHEYRRLYPSGTLLRRMGWQGLAMTGSLAGVGALLGFPTPGLLIAGVGACMVWLLCFR